MNIKRAFLVLAAALLLPGLAMATVNFKVTVMFVPANTGATTTANSECSGVVQPNDQSYGLLGHGEDTTFQYESTDWALAACEITVDDVPGYITSYSDLDNCLFEAGDITNDDNPTCAATLTAKAVTFTVHKTWDTTRVGGDLLNPSYTVTILCSEEITDNSPDAACNDDTSDWWCKFSADGILPTSFSVDVDATGSAPSCSATESVVDSAVETSDNCSSRTIAVGKSSECAITNTVFYEGIPTLNQYGLAIMALLMLGVGFVGFRRFV